MVSEFNSGEWAPCAQAARTFLVRYPNDDRAGKVAILLARAEYREGRHVQALQAAKEALQYFPEGPEHWEITAVIGNAYFWLGKKNAALEAYARIAQAESSAQRLKEQVAGYVELIHAHGPEQDPVVREPYDGEYSSDHRLPDLLRVIDSSLQRMVRLSNLSIGPHGGLPLRIVVRLVDMPRNAMAFAWSCMETRSSQSFV
jgi:tetratricopeptide (TPR) repeat protein